MRARAVIFDLDGTLADTLDDLADAVNAVLDRHGFPPRPRDEYRRLVGEGARRLVERALPEAARQHTDAILDEFRAYYFAHLIVKTRPYGGVTELLGTLAEKRIPLGVVSNKPDEPTRRLVSALFPNVPFGVVLGERPGVPKKPDPAPALEAARALGRRPADCLFVGDTAIDMQTAAAAGMVGVGVLWGFRGRDELEAAGARALLSSPDELVALLDK